MADTKVAFLTPSSALAGAEMFYADNGVADVKVTAAQIKTYANSGLGYFATGTDAANLTGTVAAARLSGAYTGITGVGALAAGSIASGFGAGTFGGVLKTTDTTASTSTTTGALVVSGGAGIAGALNVGGSLSVGHDAGIQHATYQGNATKLFWYSDASNEIVIEAANANDNTKYTINLAKYGGNVRVGSSTASTSTATGALVVSGGVGIAGDLFSKSVTARGSSSADVAIVSQNTATGVDSEARFTNATGTPNAYVINTLKDNSGSPFRLVAAGAGVVNCYWQLPNYNFQTTSGTPRLTINGSGVVSVSSTAASTSTTTGAFIVSGGVGFAGNAYVGGGLVVTGSTNTLAADFQNAPVRINKGNGLYFYDSAGANNFYLVNGTSGLTVTSNGGSALFILSSTGRLTLGGIPTADPHVVGQVWNNGGVLNISAG